MIILSKKRIIQPQQPVDIASQYKGRVLSAYVLNANLWRYDLARGIVGGSIVGTGGLLFPDRIESVNSTTNIFTLDVGALPADFSILVGYKHLGGNVAWSIITDWNGMYASGANTIVMSAGGSFDGSVVTESTRNETVNSAAISHVAGVRLSALFNGGPVAEDTALSTFTGITQPVRLGMAYADNPSTTAFTHFILLKGALSNTEQRELSLNPWQVFAPQKRRIFTFAAGAGQTLTLTCAAGAYTYTGQTATLQRTHTLTCAAGSYTYAGQTSTLTHARTLDCVAGAYTYLGQDATLTKTGVQTYTLICAAGSYVYSGQTANLIRARSLTCEAGSYTYTGQAATITHARSLTCAAGAYTYTGQASTLTHARSLTCAAGAYIYVGQDATLIKTGIINYALTCAAGAYTYAGQTATLAHARSLTCASGAYTYSGIAATLAHNRTLTCASGAYIYVGKDATLTAVTAQTLTLTCASGSYTYTGQNITFSGSVTTRQGNTGGYFDIYTGRKRDKLPPRVLKKKLEEKKSEILEILDDNPGKLKFYAKHLKEIQVKIDTLKEQIEGKKEARQDEQQQYHQNKRYEMIVRMLLLS